MPQPGVGRHYAQVSHIFKLPAVFTTNHRPKGAIRYSRSGGESDSLSEMRWIPIALVGVHGLIHLMGFAKGFGFADLPQLTQPISRGWGLAWLIAALLVTTTTAMLVVGARSYWMAGALAVLVSQAVIFSVWRDAWAGTAANVAYPLAPCFRNVAWTSGFPSAMAMSGMALPLPGALMSAPAATSRSTTAE